MERKPVILAFCCHYCAYAAADLAGSMRLKYSSDVRVLRLPCTGKVEIDFLMRAFERGADAVVVAGCLEGGCHFQEGNLRARKRTERVKGYMKEIGIEPERLEMFNLSSAEGTRFAEIIQEMSGRLEKLGPSPLRKADGDAREKEVTEWLDQTKERADAEIAAKDAEIAAKDAEIAAKDAEIAAKDAEIAAKDAAQAARAAAQ